MSKIIGLSTHIHCQSSSCSKNLCQTSDYASFVACVGSQRNTVTTIDIFLKLLLIAWRSRWALLFLQDDSNGKQTLSKIPLDLQVNSFNKMLCNIFQLTWVEIYTFPRVQCHSWSPAARNFDFFTWIDEPAQDADWTLHQQVFSAPQQRKACTRTILNNMPSWLLTFQSQVVLQSHQ